MWFLSPDWTQTDRPGFLFSLLKTFPQHTSPHHSHLRVSPGPVFSSIQSPMRDNLIGPRRSGDNLLVQSTKARELGHVATTKSS